MPIPRYHLGRNSVAKEHFKSCGTVSVNPPLIGAGATVNVDVTVSGLETTDYVLVVCQSDLEVGLHVVASYVPSANTLRMRFHNSSGASIDGVERTWAWFAFK